jgi:hypothetical protein
MALQDAKMISWKSFSHHRIFHQLLLRHPTKFIKYPPSDPEKVREEVQARIEREKKMEEQRKAYREQMKILQESAERSRRNAAAVEAESTATGKTGGLWGWLGFGRKKAEE